MKDPKPNYYIYITTCVKTAILSADLHLLFICVRAGSAQIRDFNAAEVDDNAVCLELMK